MTTTTASAARTHSIAATCGVILATSVSLGAQARQFLELPRLGFHREATPTQAFAFADVDRDGDVDVFTGPSRAVFNPGGRNRIWLNDGSGRLVADPRPLPFDDGSARAAAFGDVDGDGDADLVLGNSGGGMVRSQNSLFLNDGSGLFTDVTATHLPARSDPTEAVALHDVDADGDLDLFVGNTITLVGVNFLLRNDGKGKFSDVSPPAGSSESFRFVDVDGDRDVDLVTGGLRHQLFIADATGRLVDESASRLPATASGFGLTGAADFDGDGDVDLFAGSNLANQNGLWLNDGKGYFTLDPNPLPPFSNMPGAIAEGDVDGDGDVDLVLAHRDSLLPIELWLNDGKARFQVATSARLPLSMPGATVAVADLDQDGDLEILVGSGAAVVPLQYLLFNGQRQTLALAAPSIGNAWRLEVAAQRTHASAAQTAVLLMAASELRPRLPLRFGLLGLAPGSLLVLTSVALPFPAGSAIIDLPIPNDTTLRGLPLLLQSLAGPSARIDDWRLTNVLAERIQ